MTPFFKAVIKELDSVEWTSRAKAYQQVEAVLNQLNKQRPLLRQELANHSLKHRLRLAQFSHEPSTHFKWHLFKHRLLGYEIWIHEYKNKELLRPGYATVPHNHRYWFSSLLLSGGFKQSVFNNIQTPKGEESFTSLEPVDQTYFERGSVYSVDPSVIHTITEIKDPTITLVIRSRAVKPFSEEYRLSDRRIIRHYPFSTRIVSGYPFLDKI